MPVLVILTVLGAFVNAVSYMISADFRLWRWSRRWGIQHYPAFAYAEAAGLRIRAVDLGTSFPMRKVVFFRAIASYLLLAGGACILLWQDAPWWLATVILTVLLVPQFNPQHIVADVARGFGADAKGKTILGASYVTISWVLLFAGVAAIWVAMVRSDRGEAVLRWVIPMLVGLGLLAVATAVMIGAKKTLSQTRPIRFGRDAAPDDTLFLRSFNDDAMRFRGIDPNVGMFGVFRGMRSRFEELVASFTSRNSPLIAIGKPGEPLPQLGAARTYVSDDEWQSAVEDTAHRVDSIILVAGTTDGLSWELSHLREWGLAHKVTILLPPVAESQSWNRLHRLLDQLGIDFDEIEGRQETGSWMGVLLRTVTAIGIDDEGQPVFYVSDRRDWLSFATTILQADEWVRGRAPVPEHGMLAEYLDLEVRESVLTPIAGQVSNARERLSDDAQAVAAQAIALAPGSDPDGAGVGAEHFLVALLSRDNNATSTLAEMGVDLPALLCAATNAMTGTVEPGDRASVFGRFDDAARRAVVHAQGEARALKHHFIGSEHILLGLIHEGDGVAVQLLESLGISVDDVRGQLVEHLGRGPRALEGHIPFTPRAKTILGSTLREALQLGRANIGPQDVLLSLVSEGHGFAARVLISQGVDHSRVRRQVIATLNGG